MARPSVLTLEKTEMEVRREPRTGPEIEKYQGAFHAAPRPPRWQHGQQALDNGVDQIEIGWKARGGARS